MLALGKPMFENEFQCSLGKTVAYFFSFHYFVKYLVSFPKDLYEK
jgi:hypothetical protein